MVKSDLSEAAEARAMIAATGLVTDPASAELAPIAGLTNRVFLVTTPEKTFWLRLPGRHTAAYVDRDAEAHNARAAAAAGVAPALLHAGGDGTMATASVEGAKPLAPRPLSGEDLRLVAECFRRLHTRAAAFRGTFEALGSAQRYLARRPPSGPTGTRMAAILAHMREAAAALDTAAISHAPCHCDPVPANILVGDGRAFLVDWEYSGMADPLWDLGYFSGAAGLPEAAERLFLESYFDRAPTAVERARTVIHQAEAAGLAAAWALMRQADCGDEASGFAAYAAASLADAEARFGAADFPALLETARRSHGATASGSRR